MKDEAYEDLEEAVGSENITRDSLKLEAYTYVWGGEQTGKEDRFNNYQPEAVVLPGSTEETQEVVKACNKHGIKFKATSTGWGIWSFPLEKGAISIDMRRMDRVVEINEEDMYAVVEPYVTWGNGRAKTLKETGLIFPMIGAGGNTSALASCTSMMGIGNLNWSLGYNNRNVLGVEWVLPNSEVLELGSPGSDAGWISGDGPGPSLRGLMRGKLGKAGTMGIFTKAAIRLYDWPGPREIEIENIVPSEERWVNWPDTCKYYCLEFDSYEDRADAMWKMGENDIAFSTGFIQGGDIPFLSSNNKQAVEMYQSLHDAFPDIGMFAVVLARTQEQFEYECNVVEDIIEETNATTLPLVTENEAFRDPMVIWFLIGGPQATRYCFGLAGAFYPVGWVYGTRNTLGRGEKALVDRAKPYSHLMYDDGGEGCWGSGMEKAHFAYIENERFFDPDDIESAEGTNESVMSITEGMIENKIDMPFGLSFENVIDGKVREALDPNKVSCS